MTTLTKESTRPASRPESGLPLISPQARPAREDRIEAPKATGGVADVPVERAATPENEGDLESLRQEIDGLDERLLELLATRLRTALRIGDVKRSQGIPRLDPAREAAVVRRSAELARDRGIDPEGVRDVFWKIIALSHGALAHGALAPRALPPRGCADGSPAGGERDVGGR